MAKYKKNKGEMSEKHTDVKQTDKNHNFFSDIDNSIEKAMSAISSINQKLKRTEKVDAKDIGTGNIVKKSKKDKNKKDKTKSDKKITIIYAVASIIIFDLTATTPCGVEITAPIDLLPSIIVPTTNEFQIIWAPASLISLSHIAIFD